MFKIYDAPESPNEESCMRNRHRQMRGRGEEYGKAESPNEGACFKTDHDVASPIKIYDEAESPNEGAC